MATDGHVQYIRIRANEGEDLLCPFRNGIEPDKVAEEFIDECFERDVAERYAGNIKIIETQERKEHKMSEATDKTLCALQQEGYIESHTEAFKKLIRPAQFFCKNCGRSAVNENNLCNPEKLD